MIIQLPEWEGWRIAGDGLNWEIQSQYAKGKSKGEWYATNYYSALEHAIGAAYERTLRESPKTAVDIREVAAECERVKTRLLKAVRKAVGE